MAERQAFIDRVKGAVRECYVVGAAVDHYKQAVQANDAYLPDETSPRDLVTAADKVESTYMIRMWAEFETALRSYRRRITGDADDRISTSNLIDWAAGVRRGRAISEDVRDDDHKVREYRLAGNLLRPWRSGRGCGDVRSEDAHAETRLNFPRIGVPSRSQDDIYAE